MRVFLSAFEHFYLAIPMDQVASVMIYNNCRNEEYDYISLPQLFKNSTLDTRHGILIKDSNCILLTTRVDCEVNIPRKEIFPLPKALEAFSSSRFFKGIRITSSRLVLLFDPEIFLINLHKEKYT